MEACYLVRVVLLLSKSERLCVYITAVLRSPAQSERLQAAVQHPPQVNIAGCVSHNMSKRKKPAKVWAMVLYSNSERVFIWTASERYQEKGGQTFLFSYCVCSGNVFLHLFLLYYKQWCLKIVRYRGSTFYEYS